MSRCRQLVVGLVGLWLAAALIAHAAAAASAEMFLDADGRPVVNSEAQVGGRAVATPGLLRMLEMAHESYGRLPWSRLFEPAMRLARDGFPVSPRLARLIQQDGALR